MTPPSFPGTATTLLLDMDGVLAEVSKSYRACILATCHEYGAMSITHDTINEWKTRGGCNNDWKLSLDLINSDPNAKKEGLTYEQVVETFEKYYQGDKSTNTAGLCDLETLIPPTSVFEEFQRRCKDAKMAIVTGRPKKDCMKFLELHKIDKYFPVCVVMEDGPPKPDPFPVRRACELLGVEPSQDVIMVGDTPDDIRSAVAAGCMGVGVATPEGAVASESQGLSFDAGSLCVAMKECGASCILKPGFEDLLKAFPKK